MRILHLSTLFCLCCSITFGQVKDNDEKISLKLPSEFFPKERAQVLVVGSFHFHYPGLDSFKTMEEDKIDVLKEPKKSEVAELVEYIKRFKPTKVAIEARSKWNATSKLREYKSGMHRDKRDERYQLAMRIANDFSMDTLYSIDVHSLSQDLYKKDSVFLKSITNKIDWNAQDPYWDMAKEWLNYREKMLNKVHILDFFKHINSRESHNANYGTYLTGNFTAGDVQGADNLSIWWYNRNARIFSKIIQLTESTEDRILVVMGNGHAAILRQFLEASPQFDFVEFNELENY
nr:DUF5694 domain-containing protein [uncultured Allomuricauda sp.]